jgi:hypothetical protein
VEAPEEPVVDVVAVLVDPNRELVEVSGEVMPRF